MEVVGGLVIVHAAVGFFANRRPLFARGNGVSSTNLWCRFAEILLLLYEEN